MSLLIAKKNQDRSIRLLSDGLACYEGGMVAEYDLDKWIVSPRSDWALGVAGSAAVLKILQRYLVDERKAWGVPGMAPHLQALQLLDDCREHLASAGVNFKHEEHPAGGCGSEFLIATSYDYGHIWFADGDMRALYPKGDFAAIGAVFDIATALHEARVPIEEVFGLAARRHTKVGDIHQDLVLRNPDARS